jgi:O-antigen/teichoic acid export membrane protein
VLSLVVGPTVALLLAYIAFGRFVLHGIYAGKYDAGESLILILAAAFTLQALYNVFYCFNLVRSDQHTLRRFVIAEVGLAILGAGWMYVATSMWGLVGTSVSLASVWGARMLVAWGFSTRQRSAPVESMTVQ